ncbi:hypothetical protein [Allokutzneria oryzae]|uniref:DUF1622 domain-containing protein n=1 Tax=Allokutzneria oryzae TaxID=1378989 RepID=A0ABV6A5U5_9PSEU
MTFTLTPLELCAGLGVMLALFLVWRNGSRKAKAAAETARKSARLLSLTGRVLVMAGVIVGVQWLAITYRADTVLLLVVLGLPALFSAYTLTRALTVTTVESRSRKGDRR